MLTRLMSLFGPQGTIGRGPYALAGVAGFLLKHNLDRLLATFVFGRPWELFNYWKPLSRALRLTAISEQDALFLAAMLALALPFIWMGVALTLRRLRDAGLPAWLVVVFFVPVLNVLFFALLCVMPSRDAAPPPRPGSVLQRLIPESAVGSALVSMLITVPVGVAVIAFGAKMLSFYGVTLFIGVPFAMGLTAVLIHSYYRERTFGECVIVSCLSVVLLSVGLVGFAIEGLVCLIMAAPLGLTLALFGGVIGYAIQSRAHASREATSFGLILLPLLPVLMTIEAWTQPTPPQFEVRTALEVDAPPERVWRHVVAFSQLPDPDDWLFRIGIAYPMRAEIRGHGPGAVRHCVFSTGPFVEPIEVWDEPRLLRFSVTSNPAPMQEWTPYKEIHPPHLDSYFVSRQGQFLLTPLPGGRTRLEGTTWYQHGLWPAVYWRLWSDFVVHRIHLRVLRHVRTLAELR